METPTPADSVSVAVVDDITLARIARLEKILSQFDVTPPPLPEAEALSNRITALEGRADSAERQARSTDSFADMVAAVSGRVRALERIAGLINDPRDVAHEAATEVQEMECTICMANTRRTILKAQYNPDEIPCPSCGKVAKLKRVIDANEQATEAVELEAARALMAARTDGGIDAQ